MRATGNTYRAILRAIAVASEGENILFVSNTRPHADVALRIAQMITNGLMGCVTYTQNEIKFKNGGFLEITTEDIFFQKEREGKYNGMKAKRVFDV